MMSKMKYSVKWILLSLFIFSIGILLRYLAKDYMYGDYYVYLSYWVKEIQDGGFAALKDGFYNYTPPYMYVLALISKLDIYPMYSIKILSYIFEYILAFVIAKLAMFVKDDKKVFWGVFFLVPLIPSVLLNSGIMSQCDAIYTTFVFASIYFLFTSRQLLSMILLGIAFSLKLQMIAIMPFFFVYMLRGHIKWYYFLTLPAIYFIFIIPVWIVGRPLGELLSIYAGQAGHSNILTSFFPNIYIWIDQYLNGNFIYGMAFVFISVLIGGYILKNKEYVFTLELWIKLMLLSIIYCLFFLPGMHERYIYMGDICAVLYFIVDRKKIFVSLGVLFISFYSVIRSLESFKQHWMANYPMELVSIFNFLPWKVVSLFYFVLLGYIMYDFIKTLNNNKGAKEFVAIEH